MWSRLQGLLGLAVAGLVVGSPFRQPASFLDTLPHLLNSALHMNEVKQPIYRRDRVPLHALARANSTKGDQPAWTNTCVRNTGRSCEAPTSSHQSVVDYLGECHRGPQEHCSVGKEFPAGFCVCTDGYCSDSEGRCVERSGVLLPDTFRIHTAEFGPDQPLYMDPGGTVKAGTPPHPTCAEWRIVVGPDGTKNFLTNAYPDRFIDLFERCMQFGEQVRCEQVVGHVSKPSALETGWAIDHTWVYGTLPRQLSQGAGEANKIEYLALRDVRSARNVYVLPDTREVHTCEPQSDCPGSLGHLIFTPDIHNRIDVWITDPPESGLILVIHWIGAALISLLLCCLCIFNVRLDQKATRLDDNSCIRTAKTLCPCLHLRG